MPVPGTCAQVQKLANKQYQIGWPVLFWKVTTCSWNIPVCCNLFVLWLPRLLFEPCSCAFFCMWEWASMKLMTKSRTGINETDQELFAWLRKWLCTYPLGLVCFSQAGDMAPHLMRLSKGLMLVPVFWVRCTGEIAARYSQEVKTSKKTLLATSDNERSLAKG